MINKIIIGFAMILTNSVCLAEKPAEIHKKADILREKGKTLEALNLYNQALVEFQKINDYNSVLSVLCGRLISWQHLFNHKEDKIYAIFAKKEAETMLIIANEYNIHDRDYLIHYLFGKTSIFLKDFKTAETEYRKAINLYPYDDAEKGDWLAHLGEAIYLNGQKNEGESVILKGVNQIQANSKGPDSFRINVWISGAYLRLAKILINDSKIEQAKSYLQKAENIIREDERLVIRKQQLEILKNKLN